MIISRLCLLFLICKGVVSFVRLPCLTNDSKDFQESQKALTNLESYMETIFKNINQKTIKTFEKSIKVMKDHLAALQKNIIQKIKTLNKDMQLLQDDFKQVTWKKYNGHCYHYGTKKLTWFAAEKRCREIGGYLVKTDNDAENKWITSQKAKSGYYWLGLTDLEEGKWRWSYDQSDVIYTKWYSRHGHRGTSYNCAVYNSGDTRWLDLPCSYTMYCICESNFCSK